MGEEHPEYRFKFYGGCKGCGHVAGTMHAEHCPMPGIIVQPNDLETSQPKADK